MILKAAPLRFLALVLGCWVAGRAALVTPDWLATDTAGPTPTAKSVLADISPGVVRFARLNARPAVLQAARGAPASNHERLGGYIPARLAPARKTVMMISPLAIPPPSPAPPPPLSTAPGPFSAIEAEQMPPIAAGQQGRWSASGWALLRRGSGAQLATGGLLGGSQIGARVSYQISGRAAASLRFYSPVDVTDAAEVAIGVEWQPSRALPVRLLAERRQAIGETGRSAFSILAHGGVMGVKVAGPLRLDAYAQAGVVGTRSRDFFVDGTARLAVPVSEHLSLAAGAWGAAQPGAARLDVGPEAVLRIPSTRLRVAASYRLRIAGDARPGSGPALTLASDF